VLNHAESCLFYRPEEASKDPAVLKLVEEQTKQWTEMRQKQRKEEWEMMKAHLTAQEEILKKLMEVSQQNQMKQIEAKHERYGQIISHRLCYVAETSYIYYNVVEFGLLRIGATKDP